MLLDATITNAVTDALYSIFLFSCFIGATYHYLKKTKPFSLLIVFYFFTLFFITMLSAYVHYTVQANSGITPGWIAISLLIFLVNYFIAYAIKMPDFSRILIMITSAVFIFLYIIKFQFVYLAVPIMLVYLIVSYYSRSLLRIGFLMVVASNVLWILARYIENTLLGHPIAIEYRYDNDVYHVFLIISTIVIYKAIGRGDLNSSGR